jgi:hypothetical protein
MRPLKVDRGRSSRGHREPMCPRACSRQTTVVLDRRSMACSKVIKARARPPPDSIGSAAALAHQQEQRGVSQLQNAVSAAAGRSILSPSVDNSLPALGQALNGITSVTQLGGVGAEKRGPVEFNHAISYVNKIKVGKSHINIHLRSD